MYTYWFSSSTLLCFTFKYPAHKFWIWIYAEPNYLLNQCVVDWTTTPSNCNEANCVFENYQPANHSCNAANRNAHLLNKTCYFTSSRISTLHSSVLIRFLFSRSRMRPGVATITCTEIPQSQSPTQLNIGYIHIQGAPKKNNPLGKIRYLWNCCRFFRQIYSIYRGEFKPHMLRISLQKLMWFNRYNSLNFKIHFYKWTTVPSWIFSNNESKFA